MPCGKRPCGSMTPSKTRPSMSGAGGWLSAGWLHAKFALVVVLSGVHGFMVRWVRDFGADQNRHTQKFYRIINEIPTVLMIGIVLLVVLKPF